jgi:hypothetical protein
MSPQQIDLNERDIRAEVGRLFIDPTGKARPIYDGVVDPVLYCKAAAKILWILKEPWDGGDRSGGGWSITQDLLRAKTAHMSKGPTIQPIIYVTYGILNQIWTRADMDSIRDDPSMAQVLHSIAYINVKKLPGLKKSNDAEILSAYRMSRGIISQQIDAYQPEYVIGCRPHMAAIMADRGFSSGEVSGNESARWATKNGTTFVDVYHPAQTTIKRGRYIDDILSIAANGQTKVLTSDQGA